MKKILFLITVLLLSVSNAFAAEVYKICRVDNPLSYCKTYNQTVDAMKEKPNTLASDIVKATVSSQSFVDAFFEGVPNDQLSLKLKSVNNETVNLVFIYLKYTGTSMQFIEAKNNFIQGVSNDYLLTQEMNASSVTYLFKNCIGITTCVRSIGQTTLQADKNIYLVSFVLGRDNVDVKKGFYAMALFSLRQYIPYAKTSIALYPDYIYPYII